MIPRSYKNEKNENIAIARRKSITTDEVPDNPQRLPEQGIPLDPSNIPIDTLIDEAHEEVEQMRLNGRLRPFREGEPIGVLPRRVRAKRVTKATLRKAHNERMEKRREDMLKLRRRNKRAIRRLTK